jgi:hypothetical protein
MRGKTWEQIELQHRDDDEEEDTDNLITEEHQDDDNVFGADDMLAKQDEQLEALSGGGWMMSCSGEGHGPIQGDPRESFDQAQEDANDHDRQFHDGQPTATVIQ